MMVYFLFLLLITHQEHNLVYMFTAYENAIYNSLLVKTTILILLL